MPSAIRKPIPRAMLRDDPFGDEQRKPLVSPAGHAGNSNYRRKLADPATCERDHDDTEREFMQAMQHYKWRSGRMFPTWCEVLEVLRSLGYRKPAGSQQT